MDGSEDGGDAGADEEKVVGEAEADLDEEGGEDDEADDLVGGVEVFRL